MANVDFSDEIRDFKTAALGEDVRDSLVSIAEKLQTVANNSLVVANRRIKVFGETSSFEIYGDNHPSGT